MLHFSRLAFDDRRIGSRIVLSGLIWGPVITVALGILSSNIGIPRLEFGPKVKVEVGKDDPIIIGALGILFSNIGVSEVICPANIVGALGISSARFHRLLCYCPQMLQARLEYLFRI